MLRFLPYIVELALLVFCLIDCIQADEGRIRNLPKMVWVLLIIIVPIVGGVAWLVAGRPVDRTRRDVPWPSTTTAGFPEYERPRRGRATAPDDDPEFLAGLGRPDPQKEKILRDWEEQLRDRERRLREKEAGAGDDEPPAPGPTA